jgi:hypothetical protein
MCGSEPVSVQQCAAQYRVLCALGLGRVQFFMDPVCQREPVTVSSLSQRCVVGLGRVQFFMESRTVRPGQLGVRLRRVCSVAGMTLQLTN